MCSPGVSVTGMDLDNESSCWPKQAQREQAYFTLPSISARMRKRRAFADKELETVMLEKELRQRELQNELGYPALGPLVHPVPLPLSPNLDCCIINKDPPMSAYVSVYKYKPLFECDFQFYQFFHLKSCSSAESTDFHQSLEQSRQDEVRNICNATDEALIEKHGGDALPGLEAVGPKLLEANGSSVNSCSASGSGRVTIGGKDVSETSRTSELRSAKAWSTDSHMDQSDAAHDSGKSPHGGPVGSPAAKPLPFSVEALLKA